MGIIGDTHAPFTHPQYLRFCMDVFDRYQVQRIVHIGDEVDNHAISFHESDPDGYSAGWEGIAAQEEMQKWFDAFPKVSVCIGNHTALPFRRAFSIGLPKRFLKNYNEMWNAPKGWKWADHWIIDGVKYTHGTGSSGQYAHITRARETRMSTVIGHIHAHGGVSYLASEHDVIFGMNVGCGIDISAYAMAYAKDFPRRPTLGCGVVIDGERAYFEIMDCSKKYKR